MCGHVHTCMFNKSKVIVYFVGIIKAAREGHDIGKTCTDQVDGRASQKQTGL